MRRVDEKKHCSLNHDIRRLFYMKQNVNNSGTYTEEEKMLITEEIEKDINNTWEKVKYESNSHKG